jgi:hypothetical protein
MSMNDPMKTLNSAVSELDGARNAARVKLELLTIQARRALGEFETKAQVFRQKAIKQAEKATETSANVALEYARSLRKFVEKKV